MGEPHRGSAVAGRYELVDRLGHVGVGEAGAVDGVWRVWDRKAGGYVAARVLRQPAAAPLLRFVREHSDGLRHAHIVTPTGWAGEGELVLFTMPLVRGSSAATLVSEIGPLSAEWVAVVVDQLLAALATAHDLGIVHGDIRASHLLLEPTGRNRPRVRLSGFGLVASGRSLEEDLSAVGAVAAQLLVGMTSSGAAAVSPTSERAAPLGIPARLWEVLAGLVAGDTVGSGDGARNARQARARLGDSGCVPALWSDVPVEAVVEVADRLPPFPPGWGPRGPAAIAPPGGLRLVEPVGDGPADGESPEPVVARVPVQARTVVPAAGPPADPSDALVDALAAGPAAPAPVEPWPVGPEPEPGVDVEPSPRRSQIAFARLRSVTKGRSLSWRRPLSWLRSLPQRRPTPGQIAALRTLATYSLAIGTCMVLAAGILYLLG